MTDMSKMILIDEGTVKLALEALEAKGDAWIVLERKAKAAIREALADQPAPVAKPRKQEPLTDEEIERCMKQAYATVQGRNLERAFARAIEAAHGIKGDA